MNDFKILKGSVVDANADVIVNAANSHLLAGGGVCGAIFKKAGYEKLQEACNEYKRPLKDGEAVMTLSYGLTNAKAIIHAVGPDFRLKPRAYETLENAYLNSLKCMKENDFHSIAFPLISSGIFAGDEERIAYKSARECFKAYKEFVKNYPDYEVNVSLYAFTDKEYEEASKVNKIPYTKVKSKPSKVKHVCKCVSEILEALVTVIILVMGGIIKAVLIPLTALRKLR